MEEAFEKLQKKGKTDVESLIGWMKDTKIMENSKAAEDKVREMFRDVANKQSVEFAKFKEVVAKMAAEQKANVEDFIKDLAKNAANSTAFNNLMDGATSKVKDLFK